MCVKKNIQKTLDKHYPVCYYGTIKTREVTEMTKEFEKYYNFVKAHFSVTDIMHTEEGYCFWALEGAKDVQYVDGECIMRYVQ